MKLGDAAEKSGFNCSLLKSKDGRSEVMVLFSQITTREAAFAFYQRVSKGEFGTTDTGLMVLPASAISKK